jgi:hypothetical protein
MIEDRIEVKGRRGRGRYILRMNCLLKHVIEGKIKERI